MKKFVLSILATGMLLAGCDTSEPDPMLYLQGEAIELESNETEATFQIVSDDTWTVTSPAAWLTFDKPEGRNSAFVTVKAEPNIYFDDRSSEIRVRGLSAWATLELKQKAEQIRITREPTLPDTLPATGATAAALFFAEFNPYSNITEAPSYTISDNNQYNWTITQDPTANGIPFLADIPANTTAEDISVTFNLTATMTPVQGRTQSFTRSITFIQAGTGATP